MNPGLARHSPRAAQASQSPLSSAQLREAITKTWPSRLSIMKWPRQVPSVRRGCVTRESRAHQVWLSMLRCDRLSPGAMVATKLARCPVIQYSDTSWLCSFLNHTSTCNCFHAHASHSAWREVLNMVNSDSGRPIRTATNTGAGPGVTLNLAASSFFRLKRTLPNSATFSHWMPPLAERPLKGCGNSTCFVRMSSVLGWQNARKIMRCAVPPS
mmetsp:Transcript_38972/g.98675  ORF Transcript_38972/g.98675 Transcript_38972/m.98675 type:complete len:213 (+) Transcript_38972:351-989(+)